MEFKSFKNIESSFRQIRLFTLVFLGIAPRSPPMPSESPTSLLPSSGRKSMCWIRASR